MGSCIARILAIEAVLCHRLVEITVGCFHVVVVTHNIAFKTSVQLFAVLVGMFLGELGGSAARRGAGKQW